MVSSQTNQIDIQLLEGLISIGQREEAYRLIEKCEFNQISKDKQIMSLYLNLLCEKDLAAAASIQKDLVYPRPSDLLEAAKVESEGWNEEQCIDKLIEDAMPEKTKERKTVNVTSEMKGGAEIFIPKVKTNNKRRLPKNFDS